MELAPHQWARASMGFALFDRRIPAALRFALIALFVCQNAHVPVGLKASLIGAEGKIVRDEEGEVEALKCLAVSEVVRLSSKGLAVGIPVLPSVAPPECPLCGGEVEAEARVHHDHRARVVEDYVQMGPTVYTEQGVCKGVLFYHQCRLSACRARVYATFVERPNVMPPVLHVLRDFAATEEYFLSSKESVYSVPLMLRLERQLVLQTASFRSMEEAFNEEMIYG